MTMNNAAILRLIEDADTPAQDRLLAIELLRATRQAASAQHAPARGGVGKGAAHLGAEALPGQEALQLVMQTPDDQLEVRCKAAAVLAETDSPVALARCNQMLRSLLRR